MDRNDPFSYLARAGISKAGVPKKMAAAGRDTKKMPAMSKPEMKTRLPVREAKVNVSGSSRGKGALSSQSDNAARANKATQETSESAKYERLESKTLKGLKGSKSSILRRGHNFSGKITPQGKRGTEKWREKHSVAAAKSDVRAAKKSGGDVAAAKQNLATQKDERKTVFKTMKAARKDIRQADTKGERQAAKGILKSTKQEAKTRFAGAYKAKKQARKARRSGDNGGGFMGRAGLTGGLF